MADDKSPCSSRTQGNAFACAVHDSPADFPSVSARDPCGGFRGRGQGRSRVRARNRDGVRTSTNSSSRGDSRESCKFSASSAPARASEGERSSCARDGWSHPARRSSDAGCKRAKGNERDCCVRTRVQASQFDARFRQRKRETTADDAIV